MQTALNAYMRTISSKIKYKTLQSEKEGKIYRNRSVLEREIECELSKEPKRAYQQCHITIGNPRKGDEGKNTEITENVMKRMHV